MVLATHLLFLTGEELILVVNFFLRDDLNALIHLYGTTKSKTTLEKFPFHSDNNYNVDLCKDSTINAITVTGNGSAYVFKGKKKLNFI